MTEISADNLRVSFGNHAVLDGVTIRVPSGSLVSVLGPSGCGKTTLLRAVAGLTPVSGGSVSIGGAVVSSPATHVAPEFRSVGWMPQDASLFPHLTVRENIAFGIRRLPAVEERVRELAELVGLTAHLDRSPAQLSGGQAQRVSLARALAPEPSVMLLDEPFAALDPMLRVSLRGEVSQLLRAQRTTAILVTHDQDEALSLSDTIAVMLGGRILQWGTPVEVYEEPTTPWVARFVGDTVDLSARYESGRVRCALGNLSARVMDDSVNSDAPVRAVLRPEWIELSPGGHDATVTAVSYSGHDALVALVTPDGTVAHARVPTLRLPRVGDEVGLRVRQSALVYR